MSNIEKETLKQEYELKVKKLDAELRENQEKAKIKAKQDKLTEKRGFAKAKKAVLDMYEKDYPFCPKFISQLAFFRDRYDNWVNAKDLDYMTEMQLLAETTIQYKSCIDILSGDIRNDPLGFYNKFIALEKKVSSLEKLIKK